MIETITKYQKSTTNDFQFSLLIPTWNNLAFLKKCIESIRKNSILKLQIIVIVNEGNDGTLPWLENQNDVDYIHAQKNIGICYALNIARSMIKSEYIVYINDDMYLLPNWDVELFNEIKQLGTKSFMLSCTMIEPTDSGNPSVVVKDFGNDLAHFDEKSLLNEYPKLTISDWNGGTWPPNVVHTDMWDLVGGLSVEFTPGMYSDPDFSKKLFDAGVRIFKGKGTSLVYHFGSKSTNRIKKNNGRKTFILKWGLTSKTFTQQYLKLGQPFYGYVETPRLSFISSLINKYKRIKSCF
ncbi:MAG TPA: family 2 glycosyl transferase [Marinilabiliales bacterium]|jgi:glycosyltransferase involved in cell wall biosynthesis|nr:family 2 glycosyl transferase [Marinilabiliales bacterium]